jgi:3-oxoacyl-[acyl-carrier-protein] synthase III
MLSIENAAYYVPDHLEYVEEASTWLGITTMQAKIYKRVFGLNTFPVANGLLTRNLVKKALQKTLMGNTVDFNSIKLIIHAHTGQVLSPFGTSVVNDIRNEFNLKNAIYFGTSLNNCASIFDAFEIAENLLSSYDENAKALILVGEVTFTKAMRLVRNVSVTGDAAAAIVVNNHQPSNRLLAMTTSCHGEFSKGLWLDQGEQLKFESSFFQLLKNVIDTTLKRASLTIQDISLILPHNINLRFWQQFANDNCLNKNKIFMDNILKYAHCFGADVIMNYVEANNKHCIKKGDYYLMITAGLGITLGAALFQH